MIRRNNWIESIWVDPSDVDFGSDGLNQCMDLVERALGSGCGAPKPEGGDWLGGSGCALAMLECGPPNGHRSAAEMRLLADGRYHLVVESSPQARFLSGRTAAVLHDPIAKAYHQSCKSRGLSYVEALKRVARRMSELVYALLKSGKAYDRSIIEHAIEHRREQAAHAARSHANKALSTPDQGNLTRRSRGSK